jgi:hypothetical protein
MKTEEKCSACKKEPIQTWIPEFKICNKCLVKGMFTHETGTSEISE